MAEASVAQRLEYMSSAGNTRAFAAYLQVDCQCRLYHISPFLALSARLHSLVSSYVRDLAHFDSTLQSPFHHFRPQSID